MNPVMVIQINSNSFKKYQWAYGLIPDSFMVIPFFLENKKRQDISFVHKTIQSPISWFKLNCINYPSDQFIFPYDCFLSCLGRHHREYFGCDSFLQKNNFFKNNFSFCDVNNILNNKVKFSDHCKNECLPNCVQNIYNVKTYLEPNSKIELNLAELNVNSSSSNIANLLS